VTAQRIRERLRQIFGERCEFDVPMAALTTWQVGGPADCLVRPLDAEEVSAVMRLCIEYQLPVRVVGSGSNLLVLDGGLRGVTILMRQGFEKFEPRFADNGEVDLLLGAAQSMARAVDGCVKQGIAGLEFLAGIPGSVGGGVRMNAGTHDGDISRVLTEIELVDADGKVRRVPRGELIYRYRGLVYDGPFVVTEARLALRRGDPAKIGEAAQKIIACRRERQPYDMPSAGSTFKNPEGRFAWELIESSGLKGLRIGGAQVSEKHGNFLVNTGRATAADILALIEHVRLIVFQKTGIMLEPEVKIWGEKDVAE
jgi:UDP-N-acetylmuramate dehydrogenase